MTRHLFACAVIALMPFDAVPASAEVVSVSDTGFVIKYSAVANADKTDVWRALVTPSRWWSSSHTWSGNADNLYLDAQATGCFCEKLPRPADAPSDQRIGSVEHMHVVYADPQAGLLRMAGGLGPLQGEATGAFMTVRLVAVEGGTRIDAEYAVGGLLRMKGNAIAPAVDGVLAEQFGRLAGLFPVPKSKTE